MTHFPTRAVLLVPFLFAPLVSRAADIVWNNPAGGDYSSTSNWIGDSLPATVDAAVFALSTAYTVTLNEDRSVGQFHVGDDAVTLDLGTHTLNIVAAADKTNLRVGWNAGEVASLRITSGTLGTTGFSVAAQDGAGASTGLLVLDGPQSALRMTGAFNENQIGSGNGSGEVRVLNGALLHLDSQLYLGRNNGNGTLIASGADSRISASRIAVGLFGRGSAQINDNAEMQLSGILEVGYGNEGTLTIDGGRVTSGGQTRLGALGAGNGTLVIKNGGQLHSSPGSSATGSSGVLAGDGSTSQGTITITGDESKWRNDGLAVVGLAGTGLMNIEQGGTVESVRGQLARLAGSEGTVEITGPDSLWNVSQDLTVGGMESAQGGAAELAVSGHGRVTVGEELRLWNSGTVVLSGGGSIDVGNATSVADAGVLKVVSGGTLSGTGTIVGDVLVDGGLVEPGASPGSLHVIGNYQQLPGSTLSLEIGGTSPGIAYDQLLVTESLLLNGTITVSFVDGFVPQAGDSFHLFSATSINNSATFSFANAPVGFDYSTSFEGGMFAVTVVAVPEPSGILLGLIGLGLILQVRSQRVSLR